MKKILRAALLGLAMLAGIAQAGTVTYFHNDIAGSPQVATDATGAVLWRESYRPYGERLTNSPASMDNKIWFTSRRQDVDTDLVYMGARYYDPMVGRFMSMDPVGFDENNLHSHNRYSYGNNNPYKFKDPDGRAAETIFDVVSFGISVAMFKQDPSLANFLGAAVDGIAVAVPFVPGGVGAIRAAGNAADAATKAAENLTAARNARDALAVEFAPLKGKAPATVTGGYNVKTGEVAARPCSPGKCAEDNVVEALGGVKADVRFTEAIRPRTGGQVPVCPRCEATYGRNSFPGNTRFKTDE